MAPAWRLSSKRRGRRSPPHVCVGLQMRKHICLGWVGSVWSRRGRHFHLFRLQASQHCKFCERSEREASSHDNATLTSHTRQQIRLRLAVTFMDYWFAPATFVVRVDGKVVWEIEVEMLPVQRYICGPYWDTGLVVANIEVVHSSKEATIELGSTIIEEACNDNWGLVGVQVEEVETGV